jgi:hypothetical protein
MTRRRRRGWTILAASLAIAWLLSSVPAVLAQTGGPYDLSWHNIGPGGSASGGPYSLNASIGQPDAATMSGGSYSLTGGFLPGGPACALAGDLNGDGQVTVLDIQMIAGAWPQATASFPYDQSGDGDLDIQDVTLVAAQFGDVC